MSTVGRYLREVRYCNPFSEWLTFLTLPSEVVRIISSPRSSVTQAASAVSGYRDLESLSL